MTMLTPNNLRRGIDVPLVLITYATTLFGILMLYSATLGDRVNYAKSQVIWLVIASVALIVGSLIDYNRYGRWTRHLYWLNIGLLVFVKLKGHGAKGAVRWIKFGAFQFQPSEFAKVGLIICLAYYLVQRRDEIRKFWGLVRSFFLYRDSGGDYRGATGLRNGACGNGRLARDGFRGGGEGKTSRDSTPQR